MLSAGIILSVMVIPFIASVMRDVFEIVPPVLKESAYGIGATTWEVVWNIVLPYTKVGVIGGIMLGLGRALGETMAVTFVIGNAYRISASLFEPGNSIASALANEFNEAADPVHRAALIALGLVLFLLTFVVLAFSRLLLAQLAKGEGRALDATIAMTNIYRKRLFVNRLNLVDVARHDGIRHDVPAVDSMGAVRERLRRAVADAVHADDAAAGVGRRTRQRHLRQRRHRAASRPSSARRSASSPASTSPSTARTAGSRG